MRLSKRLRGEGPCEPNRRPSQNHLVTEKRKLSRALKAAIAEDLAALSARRARSVPALRLPELRAQGPRRLRRAALAVPGLRATLASFIALPPSASHASFRDGPFNEERASSASPIMRTLSSRLLRTTNTLSAISVDSASYASCRRMYSMRVSSTIQPRPRTPYSAARSFLGSRAQLPSSLLLSPSSRTPFVKVGTKRHPLCWGRCQ